MRAKQYADDDAHHRAAGEECAERCAEGARQHHAFHADIIDAAALADDAAQGRKGDRHHEPQAGAQNIGEKHGVEPFKHSVSPWRNLGFRARGAAPGSCPSASR